MKCEYCGHMPEDWRHIEHYAPGLLNDGQIKALKILSDCEDRKGIKNEFWECDDEVIMDILKTWYKIITNDDKEPLIAA